MTDQVVKSITDPAFLIALLVGIAVFATIFTVLPALGGNQLKSRMKSVALERDELRAKQRARLAVEADRRRKGLREEQSIGMRASSTGWICGARWPMKTRCNKLKVAGFRGQNPLTHFLFFRLVLPFVGFALAAVYRLRARRTARAAAFHQAVRLRRRRLCRLLCADPLRQQPRRQAQAVDPDGMAGRARPDADLRGIRHVGRGGASQGRRRDRRAVGGSLPRNSS